MATVTFRITPIVDFDSEINLVVSDGPQPSIETPTPHLTRCIVAFFQNGTEVSEMRKVYTSDAGYESTGLTASIQMTNGQTYSIVVYMDNNKDYVNVTDLKVITLDKNGYTLDGDPQIFSSDKFDITVTGDTSKDVSVLRRYCRVSFIDTNPTSKVDGKLYAANGFVANEFNAYLGRPTDAGAGYSFTNTSIAMLGMSNDSIPFTLLSYSSGGELVKDQNVSNISINRNYWTKVYWSSAARKSVDLATLSGWSSLSGGTHNITIVAKAGGYIDSEKSAGVEVTKSASPKTLEESTWAEIAQVSANKSWNAMGWQVGDSKTITLNGTVGTLALDNYQCKVYIIGFDHNAEKEGQGISFGLLEGMDGKQLCLVDQYNSTSPSEVMAFTMNTTQTSEGGWKAAKMRKTILGSTDVENGDATPDTIANPAANTLMAALPADLRAVLKPLTKYTNNVGRSPEASAVTPTVDYLPLMAEFEVFGVQTKANPNEKTYQAQYEYYKSENSKIKYKQNDVASTALWWLRSPFAGGFVDSFCIVDMDGMDYTMTPHKSYGVAPVFLV